MVQGLLRPCCRLLDRWDAWPLQFRWNGTRVLVSTASGVLVDVGRSVDVGVSVTSVSAVALYSLWLGASGALALASGSLWA